MRKVFALCIAAIALAACGTAKEPAATSAPTANASPTESSRPLGKRRPLVLEAKALVLAVDDMTTKDLKFGEADVATTKSGLDDRLGAVGKSQDLTECGEGPLTVLTYPGLNVYFQDGKLAGWGVREGGQAGYATGRNIMLGSTRQEVEDAYDGKVTVQQSSLGTEWTAPDGISGIFASDASDAAVTNIWSGLSCIAR